MKIHKNYKELFFEWTGRIGGNQEEKKKKKEDGKQMMR